MSEHILETTHAFVEKTVNGKRFEYQDPNGIVIAFDPDFPLSRFVTFVDGSVVNPSFKMRFRRRHDSLRDAIAERDILLQERREFSETVLAVQINTYQEQEKARCE